MRRSPALFSEVQTAFEEGASLPQVTELIKRPLNEIALSGAADLSRIKPACLHPLGFYTLYLGDGVCIHRWPMSYPEVKDFADNTVSDIHRHSWGLTSMVLDNSIENSVVKIDEIPLFIANGLRYVPQRLIKPNELAFRLFDARSGSDGVDLMYNTGRAVKVQLNDDGTVGTTSTIEAGQVYGVPLGQYHTSSWGADTLTLMTAVDYPGEPNLTLGCLIAEYPEDEVGDHHVFRQILDATQTAQMAGDIAIRLGLDG